MSSIGFSIFPRDPEIDKVNHSCPTVLEVASADQNVIWLQIQVNVPDIVKVLDPF